MIFSFTKHPKFTWGIVFLILLIIYFAYLPGISGALYYDDYSNLQGLAKITSWASALDFIWSGHAGPLGRPIALASFAAQANSWPANAAALLHVNVLVHVANTFLLFILGRSILDLSNPAQAELNARIALGAAFLWAVLPLQVSSSLITIQRMTGLAALFSLLGLVGFVNSYQLTQRRPLLGFTVQMSLLGLGTLMSMFSKENGALTPVFALVIEVVLLGNIKYPIHYRRMLRLSLLACLFALLTYISPLQHDWFFISEYRGFSPWQRLTTEVVIVWEYLRDAFLPQRPVLYGPFRDAEQISTTWWKPMTATIGWVALLLLAMWLHKAKRYNWLLFGLLWFWVGHLLESTTVLLELVFEHRNYLAIYGFCLMLSWSTWHAKGNLARLAPKLFIGYTALLLTITIAMTTLWGKPHEAAQRWAYAHPGSARAALHATFLELGPPTAVENASLELINRQKIEHALFVLERTAKVCPQCLSVKFQALVYACHVAKGPEILRHFAEAQSWAVIGDMSYAVVDAFFPLHQLVELNACGPLQQAQILDLAQTVLRNPKAQTPAYQSRLHFIAAMIAQSLVAPQTLEQHLYLGEQADPEAMPILQFQVHYLLEHDRLGEANDAIDRRLRNAQITTRPADMQLLNELQQLVQKAKIAKTKSSR